MRAAILTQSIVSVLVAAHPVTFADSRIDEASGIGVGVRSPGVYYVQNDSGDSARFFAVDRTTGRTRAVYTVPDAENHDWEDLAAAPDAAGTSSVWLADIGDNDAVRDEVQLYRVDEPRVDLHTYNRTHATGQPDEWRLRYPSGPVNAESLAVTPHGRAYVITKSVTGHSTVYAVPRRPDPNHVQTLRQIGAIRLRSHGGLVPASLQRSATGAAISADGRWLAVRTYTDAYLWRLHHSDVAAALRTTPRRVRIPLQQQGEGICFDNSGLVLDSEGRHTAVEHVAVHLGTKPSRPESPHPTVSTHRPVASHSPTPAETNQPAADSADHAPSTGLVIGISAAGLIVVGAGALALTRRRRGG